MRPPPRGKWHYIISTEEGGREGERPLALVGPSLEIAFFRRCQNSKHRERPIRRQRCAMAGEAEELVEKGGPTEHAIIWTQKALFIVGLSIVGRI